MTHRMFWQRTPFPGNVGDIIGPWLYEQDTGTNPTWVDRTTPGATFTAGSIAGLATDGAFVWGSGFLKDNDKGSPTVTYTAIRGPLSRELVLRGGGTCPRLYGDPALCLPLVHPETLRSSWEVGIVPHYVDGERVRTLYVNQLGAGQFTVISPLMPVPWFIHKICSCHVIASSSLHGIIIAHAYGVPAVWTPFSDLVLGGGFKFRDYAEGVEMDLPAYYLQNEPKPMPASWFHDRATLPPPYDPQPLWEARPWARTSPSSSPDAPPATSPRPEGSRTWPPGTDGTVS